MKSGLEIKIILIFILLTTSLLYGQSPYFRQIPGLNNIGNARINCLYQDQLGFIWIGTNNGVYKFDGINATLIQSSISTSSSNISIIAEDKDGKLWLGYENGKISNFDPINNLDDTLVGEKPRSKITSIKQLNDNSIIFGTYGEGFYIWNEDQFTNYNSSTGLSDDYIYTMILDSHGQIWLGTDNGINICDLSMDGVEIAHLTVDDGLPDFIIQTLAEDEEGNIWIGTHDKGVCYYNPEQNKFIVPSIFENWSFGSVKDILILNDRIWIATDRGLIEYQSVTNRLTNLQTQNEITLGRINSLLHDKEGNIWVVSPTSLYISFGPKLEFLSKTSDLVIDNIHALTVDSKDNVWYANDYGLFRFNPDISEKKDQIIKYPLDIDLGSQKIMSLYEDLFGYIWAGTFGKGIIRINPQTGRQFLITEQDGLVNGNVLSIKSSDTDIWFATLGGASKCRISDELAIFDLIPQFENYQEEEGLSNNFIYHIYIDDKNRVWFATDGSGVSYYENGSFNNTLNESDFSDKIVYSISGDHFGNIWMNVAHEGLYKYDGSTITPYLDDPDHKNLSFSGIHSTLNSELVIVYNDGIDVLNIESGDIIHYEGNAGLAGNSPNLNTIDSDSKGNTWIGTSTGIVKYSASNNHEWTKPVAIINEVSVYLEKINLYTTAEFKYSDNHFSFDYSGLWFQYPEKVDFLIKLEGHDLNWIKTKNNNVIYSNLKPGEYTFQVKAALYNNFENASIACYSFSIENPFWTSIWFYLILFLVIGILLILYIKYRENKLKQKQVAIQEKIKFQFENLKSQINPHFLFNSFSTLIALIESDQEEAIEYVDELSTLFRNILEYRDQNTITIKEELSIIDNYYQLQKKRFGDNLELDIDQEVRNESINIPPMTLQLLIENAIKHNIASKNKPLNIKVYLGKESFLFVENNLQLKNDELKSTGIGIQNIIDRYKLITDKEIKITQTDDLFKVGLPIIK